MIQQEQKNQVLLSNFPYSVKRALQLEDKENSPAKRHAPNRNYSPLTGTQLTKPAGNSRAGGKKTNPPQTKEPMTDAERILFLRSKVKKSLKDLMKYRQQLETLLVEIYDETQKVQKGEYGDQNRKQIRQLSRRLQPHARKAQRSHGHQ
ncbi:hypothetical protein DPX16_23234 [Anabarilius grahami]|uniref:Uncharacterized protein n=1 Tax=Anabarilius grahami TaxID=495550 RepID=A0A3N0YSL7_ANAGA|nr:hypothetical protein DPX16_23234 [Anabarilius grahami]